MTTTIDTLATYLGKQAELLLTELPFLNWTYERSIETDIQKPRIDYVFVQAGMDLVSDLNGMVRTVFIYSNKSRRFDGDLEDLPLKSNRQSVISRLGLPSKSGGKISDPILGDFGPWDRFSRSDYTVHIEYDKTEDVIAKVTIMRVDIVPK